MFEQIGKQLAKADDRKAQTPRSSVVLFLVFVWAFSGWLVANTISSQLHSLDNLKLANAGTDPVISYTYGQPDPN